MSDGRPDERPEVDLDERTDDPSTGGSDRGEAFRRAEEAGELEPDDGGEAADQSPIDGVFRSGS